MKLSTTSIVVIGIVVVIAVYLIYSYNNSNKNKILFTNNNKNNETNLLEKMSEMQKHRDEQLMEAILSSRAPSLQSGQGDQFMDPIKRQDVETSHDYFSYPQLRLPREVLKKYDEYYEKNGTYPDIGQMTQPIFDSPILNGMLIKELDETDVFDNNAPMTIPLFRVKSVKNANRFFYYTIDQRYQGQLQLKVPLDKIKVNGKRYDNSDFYGIPELYDGDIIENIPIFQNSVFKVYLYKTHHFP